MVKRIGVIGGGQLAWMMAAAAEKLGLELVIQTPAPTDPAVAIAARTVLAPVHDAAATAQLAEHCDVITFENEFVDLEALSRLEQQGARFYPSLASLAPLLDKYHQRACLQALGLPVPRFLAIEPDAEPAALGQFGFPVVLKSRRLGYDGQGTHIVQTAAALTTLLNPAVQAAPRSWLLEEFIPFERELAVMAARAQSGEVVVYPVVETQQQQQVCRRVIVTADIAAPVVEQVNAIAHTLLDRLDFVGVMGIEFFLTREGKVLVNETAPRTHNSGHYTLDAARTSQFEQQLRAVCGLPLTSPELHCAGAVMVNLLGYETAESHYSSQRQQLARLPRAQVYWYGKSTARPGRKLGHVTVLLEPGDRRPQALAIAQQLEAIWYPSP